MIRPVGRWTRALAWAARVEGRDFRGEALDGDPPAHLDPMGRAARAANDVTPAAVPDQMDVGVLAPEGAWPLRRQFA